jgi:hypothetical protein
MTIWRSVFDRPILPSSGIWLDINLISLRPFFELDNPKSVKSTLFESGFSRVPVIEALADMHERALHQWCSSRVATVLVFGCSRILALYPALGPLPELVL